MIPAAHSDHTATRSRSIRRATCPAAASPRASPTPNAVTTSPQPGAFPPQGVLDEDRHDRQHRPDPRERDHQPARHRGCDRVLTQESDPVAGVAEHAAEIHLLVRVTAQRAQRDAEDHRRREQERCGIDHEGERRRTVAEHGDARAEALRDAGEGRERDPTDRQGRVGADHDQRVGVGQLAAGNEVGQRRVARRGPQQRQALDHEREQVDRPELMQERHRQVQHAPADVGGDHQLLAVEAIDERACDRSEHERRKGAGDHHAGDGDAGGADAPDPRDDRGHRDEAEPVAERRHHHRGEQPGEAAVGEQILDRGRASAAEFGDLVRDRRRHPSTP